MDEVILDVGCSNCISHKYPNAIGVDLVKGACDIQASAEQMPFKTAVFDVIHAKRSLYIMENQKAAFAEMVRVAKHGAKLVMYNSSWIGCLWYKVRWFGHKKKPYRRMKTYTKHSIGKLAIAHGLVNIRTSSERTDGRRLPDVKLEADKP